MNTKKTILVVDDTKVNIELLIDLLSDLYDVMVALDARIGIEIVKENPPDLILLDVMMPGIDGFQMCQLLKKSKKTKSIPVIFLTAKTDEESIEKAYDVGASDYVSKPFMPKELLARVATHLKIVDLVSNLEKRVKRELTKRLEQEKILLQQSKLASIGEMMDVIAHQWMQPLSVIHSQISLLGFDMQFHKVNEAYIENLQKKFSLQINHMTDTLKEFRNFFRPSTKNKHCDSAYIVKKSLSLVEDEFRIKSIEIQTDIKNTFTFYGIENEFIHLVLNILNNAKDALESNKIENKKIVITLFDDPMYNYLSISDNAGGIPDEIINDIFKINVTNKDKGTGIGLYMSRLIAQKHQAKLCAKNKKNGAVFTLEQKKDI